MTRAIALVAAAASVLLLTACAPEPPLPAPMTQAEAQELVDEQSERAWTDSFPEEPMPVIEPVEYVDSLDPGTIRDDCLRAAVIPGVVVGNGSAVSISQGEAATMANILRAQLICAMKYPLDLSDPESLGLLSDAQLAWNWNYNQQRLVPCLQLLGYALHNQSGEYVPGSHTYWVPYYEMMPTPRSNEEWALIDRHCPPSPVGEIFRPTEG